MGYRETDALKRVCKYAEKLGYSYEWDSDEPTISIYDPNSDTPVTETENWSKIQKYIDKINETEDLDLSFDDGSALVHDDEGWCDEDGNDYELPLCKDRAEQDEHMGSVWEQYIMTDRCDDEEWANAGKEWAKDMLENGAFDEEQYQETCEYYDNYSW